MLLDNFDTDMIAKQNYTLVVKHNGTKEEQISYTTKKSKKYIYTNEESVTPSMAQKTTISVPKGSHKYTVYLTGTQAKSGGLRFFELEKK